MNSVGSEPALIGLDWGTTSFRAYLIDAEGGVLDRINLPHGILQVPRRDFEGAFPQLIGDWLEKHRLPVIASGMITSRNGWVETPYIEVPGGACELVEALECHQTSSGVDVHFIAGMMMERDDAPDVMRGEETQIVGAAACGQGEGVFVMPGTHSKWVSVDRGSVKAFLTFMTGEIFAALKLNTILGILMEDGHSNEVALQAGARAARTSGPELLHRLFSVRTLPLFERISEAQTEDHMSGLLIGAEVQGAASFRDGVSDVTIVGATDLADRYATVFDVFDIRSRRASENVAARGHFEIARAAGLLE